MSQFNKKVKTKSKKKPRVKRLLETVRSSFNIKKIPKY